MGKEGGDGHILKSLHLYSIWQQSMSLVFYHYSWVSIFLYGVDHFVIIISGRHQFNTQYRLGRDSVECRHSALNILGL